MAARLSKAQTERTRHSIKVTQLKNRLEQNALGTLKDHKGELTELTNGQIKSATALLDKALPSLQSIDSTVINQSAPVDPQELEQQFKQELAKAIKGMTPDELQAILGNEVH